MKTKDLIKLLESNGWKFKRHGSDHDVYIKGTERSKTQRDKRKLGKVNYQKAWAKISPQEFRRCFI